MSSLPAASAASPSHGWIGASAAAARLKSETDEMLRVDHAGEVGAVEIYRGQAWALRGAPIAALLEEMQRGEEAHVRTLDTLLAERRVRPSALVPLWRAAGFALGAASALLGSKSAMAVTVAVETSISAHYNDQVRALLARGGVAGGGGGIENKSVASVEGGGDGELVRVFALHRDEEIAHHDTAVAHGARDTPAFPVINAAVSLGCALAIQVAKRV